MSEIQDTIEFTLVAEETVVNTTVKLTATISSIIGSDTTDKTFKVGVRDMMNRLISETSLDGGDKKPVSWQFSNIMRSSHSSGKEQITLLATARVHEDDNHSLDKRIREVSQEGLSITKIDADTTPPTHMIETAESNLRLRLLDKAREEMRKVNINCAGGDYRLGRVVFENSNDYTVARNAATFAKTAMMSLGSTYNAGFDDEDTLGNAVKLAMRAQITLSRSI